MSSQMKKHWNEIYTSLEVDELGWYEEKPTPSLEMLSRCELGRDDPILDVGCGATTFIDSLLELGFKDITCVDISEVALNKLKERLKEKASRVKFMVDDITRPVQVGNLRDIALWHDRALLHFLLEEREQQSYLETLKKVVRRGGYVIIATFSLKGAKKCSGLDVKRYDQNMLARFLGSDFELKEYFDYTYHMPLGGVRPYIYTLFQKKH